MADGPGSGTPLRNSRRGSPPRRCRAWLARWTDGPLAGVGTVIDFARSSARLESATDSILQLLAVAAAQRQSRAAGEKDYVLAVEPRLQFTDTFDIDDVRAVNPE